MIGGRLSRDEWALELARVTSRRSTCIRRNVGCVLLDDAGHVLATGYNGVASGMPHCNDRVPDGALGGSLLPNACAGAFSPSGTDLDACQAIHAEQNALLQCADVRRIHTCYSTTSPCITCVKLLMNTGCRRIVFADAYPHESARDLWLKSRGDRLWIPMDYPK